MQESGAKAAAISVALEPENHAVSHFKYDGKASRLRSVYPQERRDGVTLCDAL